MSQDTTTSTSTRWSVLGLAVKAGLPAGAACWVVSQVPSGAVTAVAVVVPLAGGAAGLAYSWDRTTAGDRARWMRARMDGRAVPLAERLRARFVGLPQTPGVDPYGDQGIEVLPGRRGSTVYRLVAADPGQQAREAWLCRLAQVLDAAGYASGRAWTQTVAAALVTAGPVPTDGAPLRAWMDTVSAQLLAGGIVTRIEDLQALTRIAIRLGLPDTGDTPDTGAATSAGTSQDVPGPARAAGGVR